jgi:hypothetical protein
MPNRAVQAANDAHILAEALCNAGRIMGLSQADIGQVIGKDRSALARGIVPASKSGELALLLIRIYRSLYVLVGGDPQNIHHWVQTENRHIGGVPAQVMKRPEGLVRTVEYLDAMRGKV